jgi:hypothetical protein
MWMAIESTGPYTRNTNQQAQPPSVQMVRTASANIIGELVPIMAEWEVG